MRIAVGGIHIECSTFNPVLTHEAEFRTVKGRCPTGGAPLSVFT